MREKLRDITNICLLVSFAALSAFISVKYILPAILPFLIGWGVAFLTRRPADFIARKTHLSRKLWRPVLSVLLMLALIGVFVFAVVRIATEAWGLFSTLGKDGTLSEIINSMSSPFESLFEKIGFAPELEAKITEALTGVAGNLLSRTASVVTSFAGAIPKIILFVLITAISTVYFSVDLENVNKRVYNLLPESVGNALVRFKDNSLNVMVKYLRSYLLIMLLTFAFMFFGLSLLGVRYSLLMGFIIALLDVLPIIGIGIVLIPWGLFTIIVGGNIRLGVGLLVLYAVGTVVRQIAEPKIVGKELGIHPLLTLVLMYVGYSLFGIVGLVLLPVLSVAISMIPPRSDKKSDSSSSDIASQP